MCQATGALTAIVEKRRRMWRFPLIYCVTTWEFFLFQPLIAVNLLMFGAIFVGLRRERPALLRAGEPPSIRRSRIKPSIAPAK